MLYQKRTEHVSNIPTLRLHPLIGATRRFTVAAKEPEDWCFILHEIEMHAVQIVQFRQAMFDFGVQANLDHFFFMKFLR